MTLIKGVVGEEFFLQGKFLSVGINSSGTIGTRNNATAGVTTDAVNGYLRLGLVADTDGFGTGAAAMRDAVVRGVAVEGYNIGYKTGGTTYVHSNQERDGLTEIAGKGSLATSAGQFDALWNGQTKENLAVDQKITLTDDAKFLRFEVTLTNESAAAMTDVKYMRTVDPDLGSAFATVNTVVRQGDGGALVTAAAAAGANPMFLYANDARAVVSTYGFINDDPYAAAVSNPQAVGTTTKTDTSMSINFKLGNLAVGQSTKVVFYMGVTDNLKTTIAQIDALGTTPTPPTNIAPTALDDALAIVTGDTGKGNVLSNDKDGNGDSLTATLKSGPANGTVTLAADGSFTYKAKAGFVGTDSFTYAASDGKASDTATVKINVAAPPNNAPVAFNDTYSVVGNATFTANVLANDTDANGDKLSATLKAGPANGTVSLAADGSFVYKANAGFVGVDSFTYTATDGKATSGTATVSMAVSALPPVQPGLPDSSLVQRVGTVNGSAASSDTLSGIVGHNSFFFDLDVASGKDRIVDFGRDDVLVTDGQLYDGNKDGIITFSKNGLRFDGPISVDSVVISGVSAVRYLGTDEAGLSVYANAATRPTGAIEGRISDDVFTTDSSDLKKNVFFYDTALDIHLGDDTINNFGARDLLVTTSKLASTSLGSSGIVKLVGGSGVEGDTSTPGEAGTIDLNGIGGGAVSALEFDGSVLKGGVTYYVYSHVGSSVGVADAGL